jgi:hypothetical protein
VCFPLSAACGAALPLSCFSDTASESFLACVRKLILTIEKSPAGQALLRAALLRDVAIGLDPLLESDASFYYPQQRRLDLGYQPQLLRDTEKGASRYLASLTGGLRRVWQHSRGLAPDTALEPEGFLRYCRTYEADVVAMTHLVAWELRGAGACFFWRYLLAGPDGDVATAFSRTAAAHPRHQFDGTALRAAFLQWFQVAERVDASDHQALELIDMSLLGLCAPVSASFFRKNLDFRLLSLLGALPQGGNYLSGMRFRTPQMRRKCDPFNQTHLRHIQRDLRHLSEKQENI